MADTGEAQPTHASQPTRAKDVDSPKLFFGQIPRGMTEGELRSFCEEIGPVFEVAILRDKFSGQSKGCAFVSYCHKTDADKAIASLHQQRTMPNMQHPLQVKVADSEKPRDENRKLFVGMIGKATDEQTLRSMFEPYGIVEDATVLRHPDGNGRGCGFVRFATYQQAHAAISGLHGSMTFEGCSAPIVVKLADTDRDKQHKRGPPGGAFPTPGGAYQQHQPYGQAGAGYQQGQQGPTAAGMGMGMAPGSMMMNPALMGLFNPIMMAAMMPQVAAMMGMDANGSAAAPVPMQGAMGAMPPQAAAGAMPTGMHQGQMMMPAATGAQGPEGANLFIYHLPNEWSDTDLYATFAPFGNVISAKVYIDRNTGLSKCFGFVSYDNVGSASNAIQSMNGYQVGNKRLKVQVKTARNAARPY